MKKFAKIFDFNYYFTLSTIVLCKIDKLTIIGKAVSIVLHPFVRFIFNCDISPSVNFGKKIIIPHAVGIVIGAHATIGDGTVIMPNVVIGSKHYPNYDKNRHPIIGKNCIIGANSVILGPIVIDDGAKIKAGSVIYQNNISVHS